MRLCVVFWSQPEPGAECSTYLRRQISNNMFSVKKLAVTAMLALIMSALPLSYLHAQQHTAPSPDHPSPEVPPPKQVRKNRGPGQQLVHESREAAGEEEDETAEFKRSGSVVFIANHLGVSLPTAYLICILLNFAVIAIVILWASRKYLPGAFKARTAAIQKAMQEAQKASEEARRKLAEIDARLAKLDIEIAAIRDTSEKEGAAEEARVKAAAEEEKHRIVESAQQEIAAAAKAARRNLTVYAADLAVGLAKNQIRVDANKDQALIRNFAGQLGADSPRKDGR
jgi:F-type H+-transporting ATPase subunit b